VVITSPPYATQRQYDPSSGFEPVPPERYVAWFQDVAAAIESVLAPDGSYFLNIKAHAEEGEQHTYVMDLVLAHKRQWGWRFVDEFCWRKTDDGVPGGWSNRFKNAWERSITFHASARSSSGRARWATGPTTASDYSPDNPKSTSAADCSARAARPRAGQGQEPCSLEDHTPQRQRPRRPTRWAGAPSNVIEAKTESSQGNHSRHSRARSRSSSSRPSRIRAM
jgi:hypothetical protein